MDRLTKCLAKTDADSIWLDNVKTNATEELCVVSFDCDHFRDLVGCTNFPESDKRLIEISNIIMSAYPDTDVVRSGGDEFLMILPFERNTKTKMGELVEDLAKTYKFQPRVDKETTLGYRIWRWITRGETEHFEYEPCDYLSSVSCYISPITQETTIDEIWEIHDNATSELSLLNGNSTDGRRRGAVVTGG